MSDRKIKIRKAHEGDIDTIFNLWIESMKYHEKLDSFTFGFDIQGAEAGKKFIREQYSKDTTILLIAEKNEKIVGYLLGEIRERLPFQKLHRTGYIFDIVVLEKERRKGIGTGLLEKAFDFFKDKNIGTVMLNVSEKNRSALKFYEKHKFVTFIHSMVRRSLY